MKVVIAKSLLEPVGIPWFSMMDDLLWDIEIAINRYIRSIEERLQDGSLPNTSAYDIKMGLIKLIRGYGVKEVYIGYRSLKVKGGERIYRFHISYRVPGEEELREIYTSLIELRHNKRIRYD